MVENVKLTQTTVSWDPVLRGVKGGYLDQANLIYNVYINGEKVGEVKNATSYEWPSDSELPFAGYVATVTVDNHGYISEMSEESDILRFGKEWTLPFEVAPTSVEALAFTPFDLNEDENTWDMYVFRINMTHLWSRSISTAQTTGSSHLRLRLRM